MRPRLSATSAIVHLIVSALLLIAPIPAGASCYSTSQELPADQVDAFLTNPGALLQLSGAALVSRVRDLVATNQAALPAVIAVLQNASPDQKSSIGTGLGQAAQACLRSDQAFATAIQQAVANSGNQDMILAFNTTTGGTVTAAAGGGAGGGGGGGLGGPTGSLGGSLGGGGTAQSIGSWSTPNLLSNYLSGGVSSAGSSTTSTTTTITRSVSP